MLHAVTRDRHDFAAMAAALPPAELRPIDLAGHGDAPRLERYSIATFAAAVALPGRPVVLYGHSLGGVVALAVAARDDSQVRAVVMEEPPLFETSYPRLADGQFLRGFETLRTLMAGEAQGWSVADWERAVAGWRSGHGRTTLAEALGPEAVARRARQLATFDPAILDALIAGDVIAGNDPLDMVRRAGCPVVLIAGERHLGSALTAADLDRVASLPDVTVVEIAGEGHYIHETNPAPCIEALVRAIGGSLP